MTEDRKLADRSSTSDRLVAVPGSAERRAAGSSTAARAGSSAPSSLEDALRALADARSELNAVRSERDRLQREVAALGEMQTETIALGADDEETALSETLPTIDELMAGLNSFEEGARDRVHAESELDEGVMLAPELLFEPDDEAEDPRTRPIVPIKAQTPPTHAARNAAGAKPAPAPSPAAAPAAAAAVVARARTPAPVAPFAPVAPAQPPESPTPAVAVVAALHAAAAAPPPRRAKNSRLLVCVDAEPPIKYPLFKTVMTIGRAETADIRVDGDFISRVHARVTTANDGQVSAEDVASKNGIKVNGQEVRRQVLRHGDVLSLGRLHFTFIDTSAADDE
jgi:hypothetical protein